MFLVDSKGNVNHLQNNVAQTPKLSMNNVVEDNTLKGVDIPFYKQTWFWLLIVIIVLGYMCFSNNNKKKEITKPSIGYYF
jgi:hypothetical protein